MYEIHAEVCEYSILLKQLNQTSENLTVLQLLLIINLTVL
jgi:hypothetical protein